MIMRKIKLKDRKEELLENIQSLDRLIHNNYVRAKILYNDYHTKLKPLDYQKRISVKYVTENIDNLRIISESLKKLIEDIKFNTEL